MKKIMFNDRYGLTEAVLTGRKTMTRRIIKTPRTMEGKDVYGFSVVKYPRTGVPIEVMALDADGAQINNIMPKFNVGEVVAVAQEYEVVFDEFASIVYAADFEGQVPDNFKAFGKESDYTLPRKLPGWRNKMFVRADLMPHHIRITSVRVERLQDISDEDCLREGVYMRSKPHPRQEWEPEYTFGAGKYHAKTPAAAFAALIDEVSGKGAWQRNPWVFVYEFELVN